MRTTGTVPRSIRVGCGSAHKIIRMITVTTSVQMPAGVREGNSSRHGHDGRDETQNVDSLARQRQTAFTIRLVTASGWTACLLMVIDPVGQHVHQLARVHVVEGSFPVLVVAAALHYDPKQLLALSLLAGRVRDRCAVCVTGCRRGTRQWWCQVHSMPPLLYLNMARSAFPASLMLPTRPLSSTNEI